MNKKPLLDCLLILIVFVSGWYIKSFLPVELRAPFVILSTSLTGLLILKMRGVSMKDAGFVSRKPGRLFMRETMTVTLLIFGIQFIGLLVLGALLGRPDAGSAITEQPESLGGFILDIVLVTWLFIGLGEELIFRGIIVNRLQALFKNPKLSQNTFLISFLQAIWFGAAHPSQGLSGMLIAGLVGFGLGVYFLKNREGGLWPLVVAHALIDTIVLSMSYFGP